MKYCNRDDDDVAYGIGLCVVWYRSTDISVLTYHMTQHGNLEELTTAMKTSNLTQYDILVKIKV
jgi:hypothetical protein